MASLREIRSRIKGVKSTQQITKAMKMVAAARLRRAQEKANASKPYAVKIKEILANVVKNVPNLDHPLLQEREVKKVAYFVVSSDKGLAGSYTSNILKEAVRQVGSAEEQAALVTIGRKAQEFFKRRRYTVDNEYMGFSERPTYQHAVNIANEMTSKFISGEYDEINLVYTKFYSPLHQEPTTIKVLPVEAPVVDETHIEEPKGPQDIREYIFEPSAQAALENLVPRYLEITIYAALMQSAASELGARMTAMSSATDNAQELISKLTLNYNKVRQAGITREISEIVGGAEALK